MYKAEIVITGARHGIGLIGLTSRMIDCIIGLQNGANEVINVRQDRFLSGKSEAKLKEMKAGHAEMP
jgi:hypothetical protein